MTLYFNLESLVLPDSQVHPFYTPSSRPIFGDVRRCSTMFGEVRRGSARFGEVRRCSAMFGDVRRGSAMFGEVRRGSAMLSDVIRCSAMFGDVRRCSTMFGDVIRCSAILSELQFTIVTVGSFSIAKRPRERISSSGRVLFFGRESILDDRSCSKVHET